MIPVKVEFCCRNTEVKECYLSDKQWQRGQGENLLDLYYDGIEAMDVDSRQCSLLRTGIKIELPKGVIHPNDQKEWVFDETTDDSKQYVYTQAQIFSRSGLALKSGLQVLNAPGIIDQGYRKEIGVILYNHSTSLYRIKPGDRIAQMKVCEVRNIKISFVDSINKTTRGGFGSTGK